MGIGSLFLCLYTTLTLLASSSLLNLPQNNKISRSQRNLLSSVSTMSLYALDEQAQNLLKEETFKVYLMSHIWHWKDAH